MERSAQVGGQPAEATGTLVLVSHGSDLDGGAEFVFVEAVAALRRERPGLRLVTVFPRAGRLRALTGPDADEGVIAPVPRWADFGRRSPRRSLCMGLALVRGTLSAVLLLRRMRPLAVVSNTMVVPAHAVAARLLGIPHHWLVHEFGKADHDLHFVLGYERTLRLLSRLSSTVTCCSRAVEESLLAVAPEAPTRVVYYGVDSPKAPPAARPSGRPLRAVLVGRYSDGKGQDLAVRAVARARATGTDVHLSLVGPGDPAPSRALARRLGVDDLVHTDGATDDVLTHWRAADVALMCSRAEAFGRVTVEAMRAGLPVCGVASGGTQEIVLDGINGLLSPVADVDGLAGNLVRLSEDEALRARLAAGAVATVDRFSVERYGPELVEALGL